MLPLPFPKEPRYDFCSRKTRAFILEASICWLPIDPYQLYEQFGWILFSCDEAEQFHDDFKFEKFDSKDIDAKTYKKQGFYITVYNDRVNPDRVRWTLAHEIGHIVLGHLDNFGETSIFRGSQGGLTSAKYKILEAEAHGFAAELLCPNPVLSDLRISTANEIVHLCQVSKAAAINRLKSLNKFRSAWIKSKIYQFYRRQFQHYLEPINICRNISVDFGEFPFTLANKQPEVKLLASKNLYVATNDKNRFITCPRCGNERISDDARYCRMCGFFLYNDCSNEPMYFNNEDCGARNPGDARFCEYCGSETFLMKQGLLMTWEEVLEVHGEISAGLDPVERFTLSPDSNTQTSEIAVEEEIPF